VIQLKGDRLADEEPRCRLDRIKLDLTDRSARRRFLAETGAEATRHPGAHRGHRSVFDRFRCGGACRRSRGGREGSIWIIDYLSPEAIRFGEKARARLLRNTPFRFSPKDWFGLFDQHGWRPREVRYILEEAERFGRPLPLPFS
jgi:hypothetical protein